MRILLDECLPRKLKSLLAEHECATAPEMGWAGKTNGELLALAEAHFDVFVTADRNPSFQQNLTARSVAVVVLVAPTNRLESLGPLVPAVLDLLPSLRAGQVIRIE
jgi:predicted nuclease of predicted toxin-antitoxin system